MFSGLFSRVLGCLKAVAGVAYHTISKVIGFGAGTTAIAACQVATAAMVVFDAASGLLSRSGVNLPKLALYAGAVCCVGATMLLFTVGLPAVVVPVSFLLVFAWLARDAWDFLSHHSTGEAQAEATLRLCAVLCVGAVLLAATMTSPLLGVLGLCCIATATLYKFVCSDAGRFKIERRWGQPA